MEGRRNSSRLLQHSRLRPLRPGGTVPPGVDPNGPPLATALAEQLGLKLEPIKAPIEVLVITHAEPLGP